jgi:hypothetical protein
MKLTSRRHSLAVPPIAVSFFAAFALGRATGGIKPGLPAGGWIVDELLDSSLFKEFGA